MTLDDTIALILCLALAVFMIVAHVRQQRQWPIWLRKNYLDFLTFVVAHKACDNEIAKIQPLSGEQGECFECQGCGARFPVTPEADALFSELTNRDEKGGA